MIFTDKETQKELLAIFLIGMGICIFFITSYSTQSQRDLTEFDNCINATSCLYEVIDLTNKTILCNKAKNVTSCYTTFAFKKSNPKLCRFSGNELSCIVSLSKRDQINYCEFFSNPFQYEECEFNTNYYLDAINTNSSQ